MSLSIMFLPSEISLFSKSFSDKKILIGRLRATL
jgi:hypothetical protein